MADLNAPIPMLDLVAELDELGEPVLKAIEGVIRSGRYILGPNVQAFEREAADFLEVGHAVGVNSGTDALLIGLRALGIGPGDEVITTGFSFFATAEAISNAGATPVFVDIEPDSFNLDPAAIEAQITPRTRAILAVHLFGQAANMDAIREIAERADLRVLEDAAQAFGGSWGGRKIGGLGDVAAFSFFPSKNLGAYGDGGLLTTHNADIADQARRLRAHGSGRDKYSNEILGYNSRLDEVQAAVLRVKLQHVDAFNERRRGAAAQYAKGLAPLRGVTAPTERSGARHVFHQYTIRLPAERRDAVRQGLSAAEIASAIYYPCPLDHLPPYQAQRRPLPEAERAAKEVLSLPIGPSLKPEQVERICARIAESS